MHQLPAGHLLLLYGHDDLRHTVVQGGKYIGRYR